MNSSDFFCNFTIFWCQFDVFAIFLHWNYFAFILRWKMYAIWNKMAFQLMLYVNQLVANCNTWCDSFQVNRWCSKCTAFLNINAKIYVSRVQSTFDMHFAKWKIFFPFFTLHVKSYGCFIHMTMTWTYPNGAIKKCKCYGKNMNFFVFKMRYIHAYTYKCVFVFNK